jgi:hypothetical protein
MIDEFRAIVEAIGPSRYVVASNGSAIEFAAIYSQELRIWFAPPSAHSTLVVTSKIQLGEHRAEWARFQYKFLRRDWPRFTKSRGSEQRRQDVVGDVVGDVE